jgi:uncharacterized membrane protein YgcG
LVPLPVLCAAGLLHGLAAACEQLAALLTQQQQQQQQQAASSVLGKLLSPATAHQVLDAWFHVIKLCPVSMHGSVSHPKVLGTPELVSTLVPACKLAAAAVRTVVSGYISTAAAAAAHDPVAGGASSSNSSSNSTNSSSNSSSNTTNSSSSSSKAWRVTGVSADLLSLVMLLAEHLSMLIHIEYGEFSMLARQQTAERFVIQK